MGFIATFVLPIADFSNDIGSLEEELPKVSLQGKQQLVHYKLAKVSSKDVDCDIPSHCSFKIAFSITYDCFDIFLVIFLARVHNDGSQGIILENPYIEPSIDSSPSSSFNNQMTISTNLNSGELYFIFNVFLVIRVC